MYALRGSSLSRAQRSAVCPLNQLFRNFLRCRINVVIAAVGDDLTHPAQLQAVLFSAQVGELIMSLGLTLTASASTDLVAYSDADWAGCPDT